MIGRNAAGALFTAAQRSEVFDPPHSQMLLVLGIGDVVDFDRLLDRAGLIGRIKSDGGGKVFHRCAARRCTGLASGHATNAIDVTSGQPLMKPSQDAHVRGTEIYHLRAEFERAWTGRVTPP